MNGKYSLRNLHQTFLLLFIFAVAMGFLEGIVVVYMRQLYYPQGFDFPLTLLSPEMLKVEWLREIATIVMLGSIAWLAGKNFLQRFSFFLFTFAVWDIFYYVLLKWILDWPASLVTWDILFLIPIPWLGPVLAPVICSVTMIIMAILYGYLPEMGRPVKIKVWDWVLVLSGSFIILITFIWDYLKLVSHTALSSNWDNPETRENMWKLITSFIPDYFHWIWFSIGEIIILISVIKVIKHSIKCSKALPVSQ